MAYTKEKDDPGMHCLQCGEPLSYGRTDRKFCCPDCKNRYNNLRRLSDKGRVQEHVVMQLESNYAILRRLLIMGVRSIDSETLRRLGFQAEYITRYRKAGRRQLCCCFDIWYEQTPSRVKRLSFTEEGV